jgi:hypothetical protein
MVVTSFFCDICEVLLLGNFIWSDKDLMHEVLKVYRLHQFAQYAKENKKEAAHLNMLQLLPRILAKTETLPMIVEYQAFYQSFVANMPRRTTKQPKLMNKQYSFDYWFLEKLLDLQVNDSSALSILLSTLQQTLGFTINSPSENAPSSLILLKKYLYADMFLNYQEEAALDEPADNYFVEAKKFAQNALDRGLFEKAEKSNVNLFRMDLELKILFGLKEYKKYSPEEYSQALERVLTDLLKDVNIWKLEKAAEVIKNNISLMQASPSFIKNFIPLLNKQILSYDKFNARRIQLLSSVSELLESLFIPSEAVLDEEGMLCMAECIFYYLNALNHLELAYVGTNVDIKTIRALIIDAYMFFEPYAYPNKNEHVDQCILFILNSVIITRKHFQQNPTEENSIAVSNSEKMIEILIEKFTALDVLEKRGKNIILHYLDSKENDDLIFFSKLIRWIYSRKEYKNEPTAIETIEAFKTYEANQNYNEIKRYFVLHQLANQFQNKKPTE